jgi:anti-sigma regulatory factor (Ser/Thr protein kinase)
MEVAWSNRRVAVTEASQPAAARYEARATAEAAGFNEVDSYRAGLVATELATNLVKHARAGELLVRRLSGSPYAEVELISIDRGPGMIDVAKHLSDGYSTAGTAGTGLGGVRRLSDDFDIYSSERGTAIAVRLRAGRAAAEPAGPLEVAGVSIAMDREPVCGDAWAVHGDSAGALVAVADGLGHGLQARDASTCAIQVMDAGRDDLVFSLKAAHDGIRHTRGAAVAMMDVRPRSGHVNFAGIGNISGTISQVGVTRHTVSMNGTLGHEARQFRAYSYPWAADAVFVLSSDGLGSHWSLDEYRGIRQRHPATIAAVLYRDFSRQRDDVTVVVGAERT